VVTLVKAGYLVKITSWENDGDNYKTVELDGLSEEGMKAYVAFAKLFTKSSDRSDYHIGNIYRSEVWEEDKIKRLLKNLPQSCIDYFDFEEWDWWDRAFDIGLTGGEFYTRVCDRIQVFKVGAPCFATLIEDEYP